MKDALHPAFHLPPPPAYHQQSCSDLFPFTESEQEQDWGSGSPLLPPEQLWLHPHSPHLRTHLEKQLL